MAEVILHSDYNQNGINEDFFADETEEKAALVEAKEAKNNGTTEEQEALFAVDEDALLKQIDEFRTKAVRVQQMVSDRENKVQDLEQAIRELEAENQKLSQMLEEKQTAADGIVADVESQVDRMMSDVKVTFDGMDSRMEESFTSVKDGLSDDIHKENVRVYRNIQKLLEENDHSVEYQLQMARNYKSLKTALIWAIVLAAVNMGGLAYLILTNLGIL